MKNDKSTVLIVEIVKQFLTLVRAIDSNWKEGYLRFSLRGSSTQIKLSYKTDFDVFIVDSLQHKELVHSIHQQGKDLLASFQKSSGLFLLKIESNLQYKIDFEYENIDRWPISQVDGATGIPLD